MLDKMGSFFKEKVAAAKKMMGNKDEKGRKLSVNEN